MMCRVAAFRLAFERHRHDTLFEKVTIDEIERVVNISVAVPYLRAEINVLLEDYNAKLDFGCAKDGPLDRKSHVSTRVLGTYGYAAHEYMATGKTILTNINYYYLLVDYAKPYLTSKRRVLHIIDQCTVGQYSSEVAARAAVLAMKCLSREPKCRPTVDELVNVL
ncbi:putative non-specific serine/threonine protein kinase [Helianthus debilis subsp. tardiflorus]